MRANAFLLVLLLAPLAAAATPPQGDGALVEVLAVRAPDLVVAEHTFHVVIDLRNKDSETRQVRLFSFLYQHEEGKTCGTETDPRFLGRVDRGAASTLALQPGSTVTYPASGSLPWFHVVNASQARGPGLYQLCVVAYDSDTGAGFLPYDQSMSRFTLRVENRLPAADFSWSPETGNVTTEYRFVADVREDLDGDTLSYRWEFGHLTTKGLAVAEGRVVTHSFYHASPFPRAYEVNLTVSDGFDETTVRKVVLVQPESVAAPQRWDEEPAPRPWWARLPALPAGLAVAVVMLAAIARRARCR